MLAATALAQAVLPDTTLHLLVITLTNTTPQTLASNLAPQILTTAIRKAAIVTIDLAIQGALAEVRRSMQVMITIHLHLPI